MVQNAKLTSVKWSTKAERGEITEAVSGTFPGAVTPNS